MANPYRKNPSLFASPDDYDYIVDSGSSKERTIKANAEQAKTAADQEKARENKPIKSLTTETIQTDEGPKTIPVDLRNNPKYKSSIYNSYNNRANSSAIKSYEDTKRLLTDKSIHDEKLDKLRKQYKNLDLKDPNKVIDFVHDLLLRRKELISKDNEIVCYNIAGAMAYIFKDNKIPFRCFSGSASGNMKMYGVVNPNHTWIETDRVIYEYFDELKKIHHYNITDEINF